MVNLKAITNELAKLDSVQITHILADKLNQYCADVAKVNVSDSGDTNININLTSDEVKYLMQEFYKTVNNE